ncbi:MAG TPA: F0F1 ATP synthase subunit B [Dehalococcoidia bacterium]|nr:F0F1 ATP synthase subunit B [Dehalococcoidia bacterium]
MAPVFLGIGALGINLPSLIAQLINFTLLFVLLSVLLYKPLLRVLDERRKRIQEGLEASEEAKQRLSQTQEQVAAQMDRARQEGQALVAQAQQMSARLQEEARQQARAEAEQLLERARGEIQLERDGAIAQLRQEFAGLVVDASEKVIKRSLDRDAHRQLIEETLAEAPGPDGGGGRP